MKQILLHLFGLSQADKARKQEKKLQEGIDAKNSRIRNRLERVAKFEELLTEYEQECCELMKKGYTVNTLKRRDAFLLFGDYNQPIFTQLSAATFFAKFLDEDNISLDDISLQSVRTKDLFSYTKKLFWFYKGYYITIELKPEYGYVSQKACIVLRRPESYLLWIASEENALRRKIYLIFFINNQKLIANKIYIRNPDKTETVLRHYKTKISEEELIADYLKFRDHFK